jgi:hypothetical protein
VPSSAGGSAFHDRAGDVAELFNESGEVGRPAGLRWS